MVNYCVENIEDFVIELKENRVFVVDKIETHEYDKFIHILDPEGNKREFMEPINDIFTKMYEGSITK